jgi:ADP-heptose:LPS heptosyltransferase
MKVDTMRRVDYFAGVPLCFAGTLAKKLAGLVSPGLSGGRPKNVLLVELSEMGSTILADPAMQKLKSHGADLFFAIFKKNRPSLELLGTVPQNHVYTIEESGFFPLVRDAARFLAWTRKNRIDTVIDLELFSRFTALLCGFSGAERIVGFHAFHNEGLYRGDFLTHKVAYNPHLHISKNFIALVNALESGRQERPYSKTLIRDEELSLRKVAVSDAAKDSMRRKIAETFPAYAPGFHRIVLFNANASELLPLRRWPPGHYIRLAGKVLDSYSDVLILFTGGREEREGIGAIASAVANERCVNFAGRTSLSELTALYSISSFMLSNDSGPPHFASVTDMPTFVFFGPETPKLYGPLGNATPIYAGLACSPCVSASNHRKTACTDNVCLRVIAPDDVFAILRPVLDGTR